MEAVLNLMAGVVGGGESRIVSKFILNRAEIDVEPNHKCSDLKSSLIDNGAPSSCRRFQRFGSVAQGVNLIQPRPNTNTAQRRRLEQDTV